ncbi:unnamed protein product, partial [Laminaria digitata]
QDSDEHLAIDSELLCEIEAESWINGTRGILVESRAPPLPKLEQNCSLLPSTADDRGSRAVKAAARAKAAAALDKEGAAVLYSMPWQKLEALDVTLREPDMEVSTKQAGAKRFDDPGMKAALVGDADVDGPGGALEVVKCGKLEPKSSEGKAAGNLSETGDGGSSLSPDKRSHSNNSAATARTPSVDNVSSKDIGSNGTRMALQSSTLESTPEEDSDTSLSHDADGADRRARRRSTKAGGRQQQPPGIDGGGSATITSDSHDSDPLLAKGRDGGSGEGPLGGVYWPGGKQPAEVEGLPNRSTVDWEVAVVMSSSGADEMVQKYVQTRKEFNSGRRRSSINVSSLAGPR